MDVTSLYPWVNNNSEYPIGHPEVITRPEDQNIYHYFSVAKVDVLPPFELFHPVLSYRHNGKLVMPLCRSWANRFTKSRTIVLIRPKNGCCVAPGVRPKSRRDGVHHRHHPRSLALSKNTNARFGLFANHINKWLKIKQKSGGTLVGLGVKTKNSST